MDHAAPTDSSQPTVQQMFATLLGEIATLRRQNEDQQRLLDHLRGATSLPLERNDLSLQTSTFPQFKRFPLEIREMIWELALPSRLLAFEGIRQKTDVPLALSVPTVAQVCRESRRIATSRKYLDALSKSASESQLPISTPLWRLRHEKSACWTWFTPYKDALLINPDTFRRDGRRNNHVLVRVAEHVIVEDPSIWGQFYDPEAGFVYPNDSIHDANSVRDQLTFWVHGVMPWGSPSYPMPFPVCNLRTVDFAMGKVTKIDRNYPPDFARRLFAGDDVKVVDLRDEEAVLEIRRNLKYEMSQAADPYEFYVPRAELKHSLGIYKAVADELFQFVEKELLKRLAGDYHRAVSGPFSTKPSPFWDGELDMEVTWVKEFCNRIDVRPVHVFIRTEGISKVNW